MSIDAIRASLENDALKDFDATLSKLTLADNVVNKIIDFTNSKNFIVKSTFNTKPYNGFVVFRNGEIAGTYCC